MYVGGVNQFLEENPILKQPYIGPKERFCLFTWAPLVLVVSTCPVAPNASAAAAATSLQTLRGKQPRVDDSSLRWPWSHNPVDCGWFKTVWFS